jgi:bifunctional non-homologous end joining protein LigD
LDGYRLEVVRSEGKATLYSRRQNILNGKFPYIAKSLDGLPNGTVIDGELVALNSDGRPNFNLLQNFRSAESHIIYYAFDVLVHKGHDLTQIPLAERRDILRSIIQPTEHVDLSAVADKTAAEMLAFVREYGLEGIVAKRADSVYQPGKRSGLWAKHRISLGQEFVVGGYVPSNLGLDSLVVGFYRGTDLIYASRVRGGFIPATRREVFEKIKHLQISRCPFVNLPEAAAGRWGQGLTAEKMKECVWLLCRIRHNSHYVECRTMPHGCGRSCHHCIERDSVRHKSEFSCTGTPIAIPLVRASGPRSGVHHGVNIGEMGVRVT